MYTAIYFEFDTQGTVYATPLYVQTYSIKCDKITGYGGKRGKGKV